MAINRFKVESYMDELDLKYFCREDDGSANWILFFEDDSGVMIRLVDGGEFLMFRSLPLMNIKGLPETQQNNLIRQLLNRNDNLKLGHYSADDKVVFETSVALEDGDLTADQFRRCLGVITSEISTFKSRQAAMCNGVDPQDEVIEILIQRLIEGGGQIEA